MRALPMLAPFLWPLNVAAPSPGRVLRNWRIGGAPGSWSPRPSRRRPTVSAQIKAPIVARRRRRRDQEAARERQYRHYGTGAQGVVDDRVGEDQGDHDSGGARNR